MFNKAHSGNLIGQKSDDQASEGLMGKKFDPQQMELYRATDEVLHYIWDPIGVSDSPYARDEYWGYLPKVFAMLIDENQKEKIVE